MTWKAPAAGLALVLCVALAGGATAAGDRPPGPAPAARPRTPVEHLVVIFDENVSFDHYFATYPVSANPPGEPRPRIGRRTPRVNGLGASLLAPNNPNSTQPFRLDRSQAVTCDQDHSYTAEQAAFDGGLMDRFVETVGRRSGACPDAGMGRGLTMGYYDGNTVTAMWNYAQRFAMSDNFHGTTFGPSTPGAINLISGQTHGAAPTSPSVSAAGTIVGDPQPAGDVCATRDTTSMAASNRNVGDLLNAAGVTWGWFQGGFAGCGRRHASVGGVLSADYVPHHEPFQFYASTSNPRHLPPRSTATIGRTDRASHQYDLADFWRSVRAGGMPAVSFLKPPAYQDGHAGYSDPLDEQRFLVTTINRLQKSSSWDSTAVVIAYDDSDGWYDHRMGPIVNQSLDPAHDALFGASCGDDPARVMGGYADRCGYGPRLPLLVISPFAKANFVDRSLTDQTSILRFIEDNWRLGRIGDASFDARAGSLNRLFDFSGNRNRRLFLSPATGETR